ncbi:hypothetical protein C9374_014358 [Naegleria lovaniensis]|uniref:HIT domain-containing protein n=1 Tax=Naegleria lovaniensis TaxID=51637 RepID=A0AA88KP22_NAELO|nr:uncharacterized protein C9374_014358 [Naegleria lovaniensis]KAG2388958.1 hypothetical protein C9374_014358 [Naegleria lovaniensis]
MRPSLLCLSKNHHRLDEAIRKFIQRLDIQFYHLENSSFKESKQNERVTISKTMNGRVVTALPPDAPKEFLQTMLREPKYYKPLIEMKLIDHYCVFCNSNVIAEGLIEESEHFFALYNIRPVFPGHSLIIPKQHLTRFSDIPASHAQDFVQFTQRVVTALKSLHQTDSVEFLIQEGELSGQSISHLHVHLLPRTPGDIPSEECHAEVEQDWMDYFTKKEHSARLLEREERQQLAEQVRKEMIRLEPSL